MTSMSLSPSEINQMLAGAYQAYKDCSQAALRSELQRVTTDLGSASRVVLAFDPFAENCPVRTDSGSLVGLCASTEWLEGLKVCHDFGLSPDGSAIMRDPVVWAYHSNNLECATFLIEVMKANPLFPQTDARVGDNEGMGKLSEVLAENLAQQFDLAPMDCKVLHLNLQASRHPYMRSRLDCLRLNNRRPHSNAILTMLEAALPAAA